MSFFTDAYKRRLVMMYVLCILLGMLFNQGSPLWLFLDTSNRPAVPTRAQKGEIVWSEADQFQGIWVLRVAHLSARTSQQNRLLGVDAARLYRNQCWRKMRNLLFDSKSHKGLLFQTAWQGRQLLWGSPALPSGTIQQPGPLSSQILGTPWNRRIICRLFQEPSLAFQWS